MLQKTTTIFFIFLTIILKSQNPYSFFIAGHTYGSPGVNNEGFHPTFKSKFGYIQNREEIKFGVLTGDIVINSTTQNWDEIDAEIDTLGLPIYFAVGNHDMRDRALFEERYDSTYFSFTYNEDLFIILDPNIDGWNITGDQLEFLKNTIQDNKDSTNNIFVFFHQILWKKGNALFNHIKVNSFEGASENLNFWDTIMPILNKEKNPVTICAGDVGASWSTSVTYDIYQNVTLIASGMGNDEDENFVVINVNADKSIKYDLICLSDSNENCLGELTDYLTVNIIQELEPEETIIDFAIHPNPISNTFSFISDQNTTIDLFNVNGKLIYSQTFNEISQQTIDVSNLRRGIYFSKIKSDSQEVTQKLFLE